MESTPKPFWRRCELPERDRRNQRRIIFWGFTWNTAWIAVNFAIRFDYLPTGAPSVAAALVTTLLGIIMVLTYRRFLRETDELRRKIEVEALAVSVGVGVVGGFTYHLLERAEVVNESGVLVVVMLIVFSYAAGVFLGHRRYA